MVNGGRGTNNGGRSGGRLAEVEGAGNSVRDRPGEVTAAGNGGRSW